MKNQKDNEYNELLKFYSDPKKRPKILGDAFFKHFFIGGSVFFEYCLPYFFPIFNAQMRVAVEYTHNEIPPHFHDADPKKSGKVKIADLLGICTWTRQNTSCFKTHFNCESQKKFNEYSIDRFSAYAASLYIQPIQCGESYTTLKPVTTLVFAETASFHGDNGHYIQTVPMHYQCSPDSSAFPRFYTVLVVLPRFPKALHELTAAAPADSFLYFMKNSDILSGEEFQVLWKIGDTMLQKAMKDYATLSKTKKYLEDSLAFKQRLKLEETEIVAKKEGRLEGKAEGKAEGIVEGRAEGQAELRQSIISNMLSQGFDQPIICQVLSMNEKELADIIENADGVTML